MIQIRESFIFDADDSLRTSGINNIVFQIIVKFSPYESYVSINMHTFLLRPYRISQYELSFIDHFCINEIAFAYKIYVIPSRNIAQNNSISYNKRLITLFSTFTVFLR